MSAMLNNKREDSQKRKLLSSSSGNIGVINGTTLNTNPKKAPNLGPSNPQQNNVNVNNPNASNLDPADQGHGLCGTGQLILGSDSNAITPYTTRYRMNRKGNDLSPCKDACVRSMLPCATRDNRTVCVDCLTAFLRSEVFLIAVHIIAVAIGVIKQCLPVIAENEKLLFVLTVFETVTCIACILLRVFAVYNEYKDINDALMRLESSENCQEPIYSKSVRIWSVIFTLLSTLIIFLVLAAFILFHMNLHVGWTILTTFTSLIIAQSFHHVLKARNDHVLFRITLDHLHMVLAESSMFLKEGLCFKGWVNQDFLLRCRHFVLAYDVTREFRRPERIDVCEADQLCISLNVSSV